VIKRKKMNTCTAGEKERNGRRDDEGPIVKRKWCGVKGERERERESCQVPMNGVLCAA